MDSKSAIDRTLNNLIPRLSPMLRPLLTLIKRHTWAIGILIGYPFVLFVLLVAAMVFHWWDFPWSQRGTLWLVRWMTLGAIVNTLIYGLVSLLFFMNWWWKRGRVSEHNRPRLALTYTFTPLFYGFAVAWGVTSLKGMREDVFAYAALAMFVLMGFGNTVLRISERKKALRTAL